MSSLREKLETYEATLNEHFITEMHDRQMKATHPRDQFFFKMSKEMTPALMAMTYAAQVAPDDGDTLAYLVEAFADWCAANVLGVAGQVTMGGDDADARRIAMSKTMANIFMERLEKRSRATTPDFEQASKQCSEILDRLTASAQQALDTANGVS